MKIDLRLCDEDREKFGGPEWVTLDIDRVRDTDARTLIRWEAECNGSIEAALSSIYGEITAGQVIVLMWLARKQGGDLTGGQLDDGTPEPYSRLLAIRPFRVGMRRTPGDAGPPDQSEPSSPAAESESGSQT